MDTDDLSRESYEGILIEAEKLTHDLTLQFGVLSGDCKNETEYLKKAEKLSREIMQAEDYELDDMFFGKIPNRMELNNTLKKILGNIEEVNKILADKRNYDF